MLNDGITELLQYYLPAGYSLSRQAKKLSVQLGLESPNDIITMPMGACPLDDGGSLMFLHASPEIFAVTTSGPGGNTILVQALVNDSTRGYKIAGGVFADHLKKAMD